MFAASKSAKAAAAAATTDPSFPYVPLLLETGASSSRSTTATDSSTNNFTVTRNGAPSTGWVSPYQTDGYWGNYFNGSTSRLTTTTSSAFDLSATNFTLEFWMYMTANPSGAFNRLITTGANGLTSSIAVQFSTSGQLYVSIIGPSGAFVTGPVIPLNTWTHVAFTLSTSTGTLYINGSQYAQTTGWSISSANGYFYVGYDTAGTVDAKYNGYVSNVRLVKGVVVYTGNFTPPTSPLAATQSAGTNISAITGTATSILTCQSNRFLDNSTNNFAITANGTPQVTPYYYPSTFTAPTASPGAGYFNGTTDYLTTQSTTLLASGTGDFTIEFWLYTAAASTTYNIFDFRPTSTNGAFLTFYLSTGTPNLYGNTANIITGGFGLNSNAWTHIAISRASNSLKLFVNGTQSGGTVTNSTNWNSGTNRLAIGGGGFDTASLLNGYISNLRYVVGTAVYTGTFTPPTLAFLQTSGAASAACYSSTTNVNTSFPAANTSLLVNLADSNFVSATNGVQNNTFIDNSNYAFPITRNGTPTQGSVTPYWPNGQWSVYNGGASNYLSVPYNVALNLVSGDFTIETWFYCTTLTAGSQDIINKDGVFSASYAQYGISISSSGTLSATLGNGNGVSPTQTDYGASTAISLNSWTHVALVRTGTTIKCFVNGAQVTSTAQVTAMSDGGKALLIGYQTGQPSTQYFNGYISNTRIVKGTAVYTAAFTPSTTPLTATQSANINGNPSAAITGTATSLLTCQSNRFLDNSTNAFAITVNGTPKVQAFQPFSPTVSYTTATYGGSGYFNGSTDYLSIAQTFALSTTTTPFTIEAWVYFNAFTGLAIASSLFTTAGDIIPFVIGMGTVGGPVGATPWFGFYNGSAWTGVQSSTSLVTNTWYHIACVYTGSVATIYANGTSIGSASIAAWTTGAGLSPFYIGKRWDSSSSVYFSGYISNFRFVRGTAVYTGAFTPPTSPVTAITNTSLLLNYTNAGIYDAAAQNNAITVGDAQASTTQSKWSPTSMKFDGTGDYLSLPASNGLDVNNSDFTIECWVYPAAANNYNTIIALGNEIAGGYSAIRLRLNSSAQLELYISSNGSSWAASGTTTNTLSLNTWTYLALVRSGSASGNVKLYINGVASSLALTFTGSGYAGGRYFVGTVFSSSAAIEFWNGYIQDLRITKGVARTITTPTAAFPTR